MTVPDTRANGFDVANPKLGCAKVEHYWAAIQNDPHAARVLDEMQRGPAERRAQMKAR